MSLPAAQQRILDGIADRLGRTEPRLAAKYAMFTRLCGNDGLPRREQLSRRQGRHSSALMACIAGLLTRPTRLTREARRTWRLVLIASQVAVAIVLLSVLVGLSIR